MNRIRVLVLFLVILLSAAVWWQYKTTHADMAPVFDEAMSAGKAAVDFPQADANYFADMDGGISLTRNEIEGRDTWMVWSAGNDAFWDYVANNSFGVLDLLKTVSSNPSLQWRGRNERFAYMGLINEPGFVQATGPDPNRYGLWLDKRVKAADPFENAEQYPGVNGGSFYGWATGVIGLRLFPNPAFNDEAKKRWDPVRYYNDPKYYQDKHLVRPYRVGMSCAFCHASFDPTRPPTDPEHPQWRNLSTSIGAQYLRFGRVFDINHDPKDFFWQLFQAPAPGTVDTSLLATDNVNNPRAMNAIYDVLARLVEAQRSGKETLAGGALHNDQLPPIDGFVSYVQPDTVYAPHVLKDGADSVGVLGALERVYVSIGEDHQEWTRHFNLLVGGKTQSPFDIASARKTSTYFNATADRVTNVALFFIRAARPFHLKDAPGGPRYLNATATVLRRGKIVFAENCMRCHSSKQPPDDMADDSSQALAWMKHEVLQPGFLQDNFLSTDQRHPITEIGTNACSAVASNAIRGHVWDNFSSETYKELPSVGSIGVENPIDGTVFRWTLPGGGRGYVRVPSLVSVWASAPFFQNNSLGKFVDDPSVAGRMDSFNDSIQQLLWPQRRKPEIYTTSDVSYLTIPAGYLPDAIRSVLALKNGAITIGPIPKGTPINLIANIDLDGADRVKLLRVLVKIQQDLGEIKHEHLDDSHGASLLKNLVPDVLSVSACPDFVLNRGHLFGTQLSDADKRALIEFLKTF